MVNSVVMLMLMDGVKVLVSVRLRLEWSGVLVCWYKIMDWCLAEEVWIVEVWSGDGSLKCWCRLCWTWNVGGMTEDI